MQLVFSERCLEYQWPGHPENPDRLSQALELLQGRYQLVKPEPATEEDLLLVHTPEHVQRIKQGDFFDPDSPVYEDLHYYASLAAGGALKAQEIGGFSFMRPPGHHAGPGFLGGFCYYNNVAVAVKKSGLSTLILDFDGHHGNGTQDIFLGDPQVYFISLHRSRIFPGTGHDSRGNCLNFPFPLPRGDGPYLAALRTALDEVAEKGFQQVAVSAGFDAKEGDPLASLGLSPRVYYEIGAALKNFRVPVFAVLEGGYVPENIARGLEAFIQGLEDGR